MTYTVLEVQPNVVTVTADNGNETVIQKPVLDRVVIKWQTPVTASQITLRAYDEAGQILMCLMPGPARC